MSSEAVATVAELVGRETGMVLKQAQFPALEAAIGRVAPGMSPELFLAELSGRAPASLWRRLVDEVTVNETYFLREQRELEAIDWRRLLERAREVGLGVVHVWVAGCATGEEVYSLAVLASEALGAEASAVSILGTDISNAALERAEAGSDYSERSVRNLSMPQRSRYLAREKTTYRVKDELRALVRFRHHNLVTDPSPPPGEVPFDVVACRNVLIYFAPPTIERVLGSLESALCPGGRLLLGAADRLTTLGDIGRNIPGVPERRRRSPKRRLRRPLGLEPRPGEVAASAGPRRAIRGGPRRRVEDRIEDALLAADEGDLEAALATVVLLLEDDPLMADAYFLRGLVELERDEPRAAIVSLRRTLYLDPSFGLAAFELGRAHDAGGDPAAARRAYQQALRSFDPEDDRHRAILDQVDLGDVADACAARLRGGAGAGR